MAMCMRSYSARPAMPVPTLDEVARAVADFLCENDPWECQDWASDSDMDVFDFVYSETVNELICGDEANIIMGLEDFRSSGIIGMDDPQECAEWDAYIDHLEDMVRAFKTAGRFRYGH